MKNALKVPPEESPARTQATNRVRTPVGEAACLPVLRVQVTVRADEHPELYAELTRNEAWGFAAKRFKSLATQGLLTSNWRTADVTGEPRIHAKPPVVTTTHPERSPSPVAKAVPRFVGLLASVMNFVRAVMTKISRSAPTKTISRPAEKGSQ